MTGYGIPQGDIAAIMRITEPTLRKHFKQEIKMGAVEANAKVDETLYKMATSGKCPAATIFWKKVRRGWSEKVVHTGPSGGPIEHEIVELTPIERAERVNKLLETARTRRARQIIVGADVIDLVAAECGTAD